MADFQALKSCIIVPMGTIGQPVDWQIVKNSMALHWALFNVLSEGVDSEEINGELSHKINTFLTIIWLVNWIQHW
jgi:hypothetical protein